jgi:phage shock protein PspC (stress-responsive transcriptional regulator)
VLFGVCGGIAEYFGIDPTIVRVAFVLGVLIPPISALSILGYPLLAIVMPAEEIAHLTGQDRVRSNIEELRADAGDLAGQVRGALSSITKRPQPPASEATPPTEMPATNGTTSAVTPVSQPVPPEISAASGSATGPTRAA